MSDNETGCNDNPIENRESTPIAEQTECSADHADDKNKHMVDIAREYGLTCGKLQVLKNRFDINDILCYDVDREIVPSVTRYPSKDRYLEIHFVEPIGHSRENLRPLTEALKEVVKYQVEITSHPCVSDSGQVVYRIECNSPQNAKDGDGLKGGK